MTDLPGFRLGTIRFDGAGRASLTDMHRIAGGEGRTQPCKWLITREARDLLGALKNAKCDSEFEAQPGPEPLRVVRGGDSAGTWAAPEIARAYALFLAPHFHPWREWRGRPDLIERFMDEKFWPEWPVGGASKKG